MWNYYKSLLSSTIIWSIYYLFVLFFFCYFSFLFLSQDKQLYWRIKSLLSEDSYWQTAHFILGRLLIDKNYLDLVNCLSWSQRKQFFLMHFLHYGCLKISIFSKRSWISSQNTILWVNLWKKKACTKFKCISVLHVLKSADKLCGYPMHAMVT